MKNSNDQIRLRSPKGFTLIEMFVVLSIITILITIALPSIWQWRENLDARTTARQFAEMLRQARSDAITTNLEYQVKFDATNRRYGKRSSFNTSRNTDFTLASIPALTNWTTYPSSVEATPAGETNIQFTPDGAANYTGANTIFIVNTRTTTTYSVTVAKNGRISVNR